MKVKLLSHTQNIRNTIWNIWQTSRTNEPIQNFPVSGQQKIKDLFQHLMEEDVPVLDMIEFIFLLEGIPISLREQMVRHRVGIKFDDRLGIDVIPELMDSTWWTQSMRVMDMSKFAMEENYFIPESITIKPTNKQTQKKSKKIKRRKVRRSRLAIYCEAMHACGTAYAELVTRGVPREDARQIIPLGATHRLVWKLSLTALKHICTKRSCWIAQLGMWKLLINGMVDELVKIDKVFQGLTTPPCIKGNSFRGCLFCKHNQMRIIGKGEQMPPCPLYLEHHIKEACDVFYNTKGCKWMWINSYWTSEEENVSQLAEMEKEYQKFWNRDVHSGEMLQ